MIAAGDTPELCGMESSTIMYPLAEEGHIANLLDLIKEDQNFDPSILLEQFQYWADPSFLVAYCQGAADFGIFYNPELFKKNGVPEPPGKTVNAWDWNTFLNAAQRLTIDNKGNNALSQNFDPNNIVSYGFTFGKWFGPLYALYAITGGELLTNNGKELGLFSPEGIDLMQKLADLIHKYHVSPTPTVTEIMPGLGEAFLSGRVAMSLEGQWVNADLMADNVSYNVAVLPKIKTSGTIAMSGALSVMNTPKKDSAWEFLKYVLAPGGGTSLEKSGLWIPNNRGTLNDAYLKTVITDKHPKNQYDVFCAPLLEGTAKSQPNAVLKNFNRINTEFMGMLDPLWNGEKTYQQLVNENKVRINALVQGYRETGKFR
jgi:multiple sugar transport system substrate-binding protein